MTSTLFLLAAMIQDTVRIEVHAERGQSCRVSYVAKCTYRMRLEKDKTVQEQDGLLNNSEAEFEETVLETGANDPAKVERRYTKYRFEKKDFGEKETKTGTRTLEGQRIVLRDDGTPRTKFEKTDQVSEADLKDQLIRDGAWHHSIPRKAIAPGTSWEADEKDVLADMNDQDNGIAYSKASMKCTFEKIVQLDGEKCAVIRAVAQAGGSTFTDLGFKSKWETVYTVSLDKKRLIAAKTVGSYEMLGGGELDSYTLTGGGKFEITTTIKLLK